MSIEHNPHTLITQILSFLPHFLRFMDPENVPINFGANRTPSYKPRYRSSQPPP
jgi:hypothetical protein